jgi:hypothetical protein
MNFELPHCIEQLAKAGRGINVEYSKNGVKIIYGVGKSKNIIPFWQMRLTEFGG